MLHHIYPASPDSHVGVLSPEKVVPAGMKSSGSHCASALAERGSGSIRICRFCVTRQWCVADADGCRVADADGCGAGGGDESRGNDCFGVGGAYVYGGGGRPSGSFTFVVIKINMVFFA